MDTLVENGCLSCRDFAHFTWLFLAKFLADSAILYSQFYARFFSICQTRTRLTKCSKWKLLFKNVQKLSRRPEKLEKKSKLSRIWVCSCFAPWQKKSLPKKASENCSKESKYNLIFDKFESLEKRFWLKNCFTMRKTELFSSKSQQAKYSCALDWNLFALNLPMLFTYFLASKKLTAHNLWTYRFSCHYKVNCFCQIIVSQ